MAYIPSPGARDEISRSQRIRQNTPQAARTLDQIDQAAKDIKFGSPIETVLNDYHFPSEEAVCDFFRVYLSQRSQDPPDEAVVYNQLIKTINCRRSGSDNETLSNDQIFRNIFEDLLLQIQANEAENKPLVNFIVGPTGAGKTAFSKALFSVCQKFFWLEKIVPSRVEYGKFWNTSENNAQPYERDPEFLSFVRRCQLRDLLIYLCSSGCIAAEEKRIIIGDLRLDGRATRLLLELIEKTSEITIDGRDCVLSTKVRGIFMDAVKNLRDDRDVVLVTLASRLQVRFLVSFDGFDSTKIEHFLFERRRNIPIDLLAQMVKGLHEKVIFPEMDDCPLETHYLVYMRDTTWARLRTKIFRRPGGSISYPVYWIVPPSYAQLVQNVAISMTDRGDIAVNRADIFSEDVIFAFDRYVFDKMKLNAAVHLAFVFGSSGRRMKYHIRHLLIAALERVCNRDLKRESAGVDARTVWLELVEHRSVRSLPGYRIIEDLFLNDARQLIPKLNLDFDPVTKRLNENNFDALLDVIEDGDETSGIFGCILNYFYDGTLGSGKLKQPMMLILVRILQFVDENPHCNAAEIHSFLRSIGYEIAEQVTHFCLFVIIRTELIKWDSTTGARLISDVPLYLTSTGHVALEKLLFGITYVSEAVLSSVMIDQGLRKAFRHRIADPTVWIADCINNASILLYLVGEIEKLELRKAQQNKVDMKPYLLYDRLRAKLSKEASLILNNPVVATRDRWLVNEARLKILQRSYPDLVILG